METYQHIYLIPENVVTLTIVGFAKTGTSSPMQNLTQFWDLQAWSIDRRYDTENQFWFRNCSPKKKSNDTKNWYKNVNNSKKYNGTFGNSSTNDQTTFMIII